MKDNNYIIKNKLIRKNTVKILNDLWIKLKGTKYMMKGYKLKQLSLALSNSMDKVKSQNTIWPFIDNNKQND